MITPSLHFFFFTVEMTVVAFTPECGLIFPRAGVLYCIIYSGHHQDLSPFIPLSLTHKNSSYV